MIKRYVIIGASAVGVAAAQRLRQLDAQAEIICVSDEAESPYNKCMLADYLSGIKPEDKVYTLTQEHAKQKNITLMLGKKVVALQSKEKQIVLEDGSVINYDALLLGMGTSPRMLSLPGTESLKGYYTFHRLRDIHGIMEYNKQRNAHKAVVIGSGLSGLECADALKARGMCVTVVEMANHVLSSCVNQQGARFIQDHMQRSGVHLYVNQTVKNILSHDGAVTGVELSSGDVLDASMVICAIGLQPNLALAEQAGIATQQLGIITDEFMRTSHEDIYAAGDIALVKDILTDNLIPNRTWPEAMLQGMIAAYAMAGQQKPYPGSASVVSSAFFGVKFASCGPIINTPQSYEVIPKTSQDSYALYLLENDYLKGFLLVGQTGSVGTLRQLLLTKTKVDRAALSDL